MAAADRRALVMAAARRLFGERGYSGTRIEDIAAAAGVTKPIVYRHFDSKKALYLALLEKHERDLPGFFTGVDVPPDAEPRELFEAILDVWLDYVRRNSHSWLMLFRDHTGDEEIVRARRAVNARARVVLREFLEARWRGEDADIAEPVAEILTSGLAGLVLWWIDNPEVPKETVLRASSHAAAGIVGT